MLNFIVEVWFEWESSWFADKDWILSLLESEVGWTGGLFVRSLFRPSPGQEVVYIGIVGVFAPVCPVPSSLPSWGRIRGKIREKMRGSNPTEYEIITARRTQVQGSVVVTTKSHYYSC